MTDNQDTNAVVADVTTTTPVQTVQDDKAPTALTNVKKGRGKGKKSSKKNDAPKSLIDKRTKKSDSKTINMLKDIMSLAGEEIPVPAKDTEVKEESVEQVEALVTNAEPVKEVEEVKEEKQIEEIIDTNIKQPTLENVQDDKNELAVDQTSDDNLHLSTPQLPSPKATIHPTPGFTTSPAQNQKVKQPHDNGTNILQAVLKMQSQNQNSHKDKRFTKSMNNDYNKWMSNHRANQLTSGPISQAMEQQNIIYQQKKTPNMKSKSKFLRPKSLMDVGKRTAKGAGTRVFNRAKSNPTFKVGKKVYNKIKKNI